MKIKNCFKSLAISVIFSLFAVNAFAANYIDDATITATAISKLTAAKQLPAADIKVSTYKGTILMSGFVDNRDQIRRAEQLVHKIDGVKQVSNSLLVKTVPDNKATQYAKDAALTTKIKTKLATTKGVSANEIGVNTYNAVVQLTGFVDSHSAIDKAVKIARDTDGVTKVVNSILLKDGNKAVNNPDSD